eukprot:scaffold509_cov91-Isochrysis_galbana.AAC.2
MSQAGQPGAEGGGGRSRKRGKRRSQKDSASADETEWDSDKESSSEGSQLEAEGERERQGRPVTAQHGGKQRQQQQPQRHMVPSVPGGTRISVYWTEEPAGWFQATVVRSKKWSDTNRWVTQVRYADDVTDPAAPGGKWKWEAYEAWHYLDGGQESVQRAVAHLRGFVGRGRGGSVE